MLGISKMTLTLKGLKVHLKNSSLVKCRDSKPDSSAPILIIVIPFSNIFPLNTAEP